MKSSGPRGVFGIVVAFAVAACGGGGGGDGTDSGNGALSAPGQGAAAKAPGAAPSGSAAAAKPAAPAKTLKDEVAACQALEKSGDPESDQAIIQTEGAIADCYRNAVNDHASEIDAIKKSAGVGHLTDAAATAAAYFDDYRKNHGSGATAPGLLCDVGDAASQVFGGTLEETEFAGCETDIERRLALLVLSEAAVAGGTVPLAGVTAGTADQLHALVPKLVQQTIANTPGQDEQTLTTNITATLDGAVAASTELCNLLEDAGQAAGGSMEPQLAQGCIANAIGQLVAEVNIMVASPEGN